MVETPSTPDFPSVYKGLALFTPGGDFIYCIDTDKQARWHVQLCSTLQELLRLPESPLFLIPCYTATVERWLDPQTQQMRIWAEAYPRVWRYRSLLSPCFGTQAEHWRMVIETDERCDPLVIQSQRQRFPQLWEPHNLVVQLNQPILSPMASSPLVSAIAANPDPPFAPLGQYSQPTQSESKFIQPSTLQGYVLRLFVAGPNSSTHKVLQELHQLLDQATHWPYTLTVIDVSRHPDKAEADHVWATPTLVKAWPPPTRRLVGKIDEPERIFQLLDGLER